MADYTTVGDASAADWLSTAMPGFEGRVADVVPPVHEAYARVMHPAELADEPVEWRRIAEANGRTAHPEMQWNHITGARELREQPGLWDHEPEEGSLPRTLARRLARVLGAHTTTPESCWFAVWDGHGILAVDEGDTAKFTVPHRDMFLLAGPLDAVHSRTLEGTPTAADAARGSFAFYTTGDDGDEPSSTLPDPAQLLAAHEPFWQSPNLWWPEDRAWSVATDIDFTWTYVGGTRACVDAVLAAEGLEAYEAEPGHAVTFDGDTVNPPPAGRRRRPR
ncbi:hypothetical protein [Streptomyces sp. HNM0574]|uniref:hypothetical protein n=1 Tax=Streptomyces sp. HNM0574 TaxID=2714954 RepID=UPI00146BDA4E|nr:hypothetical protein [Streptomyces sp. HNM0574]NLU69342.1 hypothetical protein [Streptomyces sp. HNM0574]